MRNPAPHKGVFRIKGGGGSKEFWEIPGVGGFPHGVSDFLNKAGVLLRMKI